MIANTNSNEFVDQNQKLALLNFLQTAAPLPPKAIAQFLQSGSFSADTITAMFAQPKIAENFIKTSEYYLVEKINGDIYGSLMFGDEPGLEIDSIYNWKPKKPENSKWSLVDLKANQANYETPQYVANSFVAPFDYFIYDGTTDTAIAKLDLSILPVELQGFFELNPELTFLV